jgi:predicted alpha/beta-fold hydrolase
MCDPMREFEPHLLLRNGHAMTLAATLLPRRTPRLPAAVARRFEIEPGTQLLAKCHWQAQPRECPTLVLVHGLEGSSESPYMRTLAERAYVAGFNALRMNQRACGDGEALSDALYNSGLSGDYRAVLEELIVRDKLPAIFFAGYSMGGNLAFKMAGELGAAAPRELRAVCGVCPTLDLAACVDALEAPRNFIYQGHFVRKLKTRLRRKAILFPGRYDLQKMAGVRTLREFDDAITAPYGGYSDADDYYRRASAVRVAAQIAVPALILTAQDDPFVPEASFHAPAIERNPEIQFVAPRYGGHCGFVSRFSGAERYWAEARVMEFCMRHAAPVGAGAALAG